MLLGWSSHMGLLIHGEIATYVIWGWIDIYPVVL